MKKLLVISNHDPSRWEDSQKVGWEVIEFFPFPQVDPRKESVLDEFNGILDAVRNFSSKYPDDKELYLCCQGDFSLTAEVIKTWAIEKSKGNFWDRFVLVFPTTERIVKEVGNTKTSEFRFVIWREVR